MKTLGLKMLALFLLMAGGTAVRSQERDAEVPGDYFSLEGALELFKKSASPEEFEKMLNAENSKVNNLDLDGDGYIDYLRVIDRNNGNIHTFTIQAVISENELQDVAVIELEKLANGKAVLQITGDEDVYGMETIIEPTQAVRVNAGATTTQTVVNVWAWPSVQYVYSPAYTVWVSPWGWYSRPVWWHTWRPVSYYHYYSWWQPYRPYYVSCYSHRIVYAHRMYRPYRTTSVIVHNRHRPQLTRYRSAYREDTHRNRYNNDRNHNRNDYRADRSNTGQRDRQVRNRDERPTRSGSSADQRRPVSRPVADRQSSENRDRPVVSRPTQRDRGEVESRNNSPREQRDRGNVESQRSQRDRSIVQQRSESPSRRSNEVVNRSSSERERPTMRQERSSRPSGGNHSGGGNSKPTQSRERGSGKRSR